MEELAPLFLEVLNSGGTVNFTPRGISMLPMLQDNKDIVVLSAADGKLKKYDLPLYFNKSTHKYIMHRVVRVEKNGTYTMCGDNQLWREYGVTDNDIIGVVKEFVRNGKKHSVNEFGYKMYCRFWVFKRQFKWKYYSLKEILYPYYRKIFKNE
jgi:hypothetical protein